MIKSNKIKALLDLIINSGITLDSVSHALNLKCGEFLKKCDKADINQDDIKAIKLLIEVNHNKTIAQINKIFKEQDMKSKDDTEILELRKERAEKIVEFIKTRPIECKNFLTLLAGKQIIIESLEFIIFAMCNDSDIAVNRLIQPSQIPLFNILFITVNTVKKQIQEKKDES